MKVKYDTIVIGTGFGGAVTACRFAHAGFDVSVFERGRRYPPDKLPRDPSDFTQNWVWQHRQGLFDVRVFSEMTIVQAAGFGWGSLIYANVQVRAPASVFETGWLPDTTSNSSLPITISYPSCSMLNQSTRHGREHGTRTSLVPTSRDVLIARMHHRLRDPVKKTRWT